MTAWADGLDQRKSPFRDREGYPKRYPTLPIQTYLRISRRQASQVLPARTVSDVQGPQTSALRVAEKARSDAKMRLEGASVWTPAALVSEFLVACQVVEDEDDEAVCECRGECKARGSLITADCWLLD